MSGLRRQADILHAASQFLVGSGKLLGADLALFVIPELSRDMGRATGIFLSGVERDLFGRLAGEVFINRRSGSRCAGRGFSNGRSHQARLWCCRSCRSAAIIGRGSRSTAATAATFITFRFPKHPPLTLDHLSTPL
jgi:hypothetical protein